MALRAQLHQVPLEMLDHAMMAANLRMMMKMLTRLEGFSLMLVVGRRNLEIYSTVFIPSLIKSKDLYKC